MRNRCNNPNAIPYAHYGGRGIRVCAHWQLFKNFFADMGPRPSPKHTLDRIDNDKGYEPGNCRWATRKEQARNRSTSHLVQAFGQTLTLAEWSEKTSINQTTIRGRLKRGWAPERALAHN